MMPPRLKASLSEDLPAGLNTPRKSSDAFQVQPTMAPLSKEPNEAEIVLNRVNVALARSQRLIASWLPQNVADEDGPPNTQEKLLEADNELFQPDSEL